MRHLPTRKKRPVVAALAIVAVALLAAAAFAGPARSAGASPIAAPAFAAVQARDLVTISGSVQGRGGIGKYAWTATLSGARVWVPTYAAGGVTTNALGAYALAADIPTDALYSYTAVLKASRINYRIGVLPVSSDTQQTRDFVGASALVVKGTTLKMTVLRAGKKLKGATVSCFGKSAKTNSAGRAVLSTLRLRPGAKYKAKVAKKGFHTATVSFTSRPGNTVNKAATIHK